MLSVRPSSVRLTICLVPTIALSCTATCALAQCGDHQWISASDKAATDFFGTSVAAGENLLFIGSPNDNNIEGSDAGSVYPYLRNDDGTYTSFLKLTPPELSANDLFGCSVATNGLWMAAGAKFSVVNGLSAAGRVYAYKNEAFIPGTLQLELVDSFEATTPQAGAQFGHSMCIAGNKIIIGAPYYDHNGDSNSGAMYTVNLEEGWDYLEMEGPYEFGEDPNYWSYYFSHQANSLYGYAVAGGSVGYAVSAPWYDYEGTTDMGAVHATFGSEGWEGIWYGMAVLMPYPEFRQNGAAFGTAIAVSGNQLIVGAPGQDVNGQVDAGAVFVCTYDIAEEEWSMSDPFYAPGGPVAGARFGSSLAAEGIELVVGDVNGRIHRYTQPWWNPFDGGNGYYQHNATFEPPAGAAEDFALSIDMIEDAIIVGDRTHDFTGTTDAGAAYIIQDVGVASGTDSCSEASFFPMWEGSPAIAHSCTSAATTDGAAGCALTGRDMWFAFTAYANTAGTYSLDTIGSGFDTVLSVHTDCPGNASNQIACDDDSAGNYCSKLTFEAQAGQSYYIRVSGFSGAHGEFTLTGSKVVPNTCPADIAPAGGDGSVNVDDLLAVINAWGLCDCPADITPPSNGDGMVNVDDLLAVINSWGACPKP